MQYSSSVRFGVMQSSRASFLMLLSKPSLLFLLHASQLLELSELREQAGSNECGKAVHIRKIDSLLFLVRFRLWKEARHTTRVESL